MTIAQEVESLVGILGLITAGVGITPFTGMPRFCGEQAIAPRPIVTNPPVTIHTHLAWRRGRANSAMHHFIETSQKAGKRNMRRRKTLEDHPLIIFPVR